MIVAGGPGMGKTALSVAALYDQQIAHRFGENRIFASLEDASDPLALLTRIADEIGLPVGGDSSSLLRHLSVYCRDRPLAAVLDNAEGVFENDREEAERLLRLAAQIPNLSLILTIRGAPPPLAGAVTIGDLSKLAPSAAKQAFLAIAGEHLNQDPDLPALLEALDGHALSIELVAGRAAGLPTLAGLREAWDDAHAEILRKPNVVEDRLTSVRASLAISLRGKQLAGAPRARRLLSILAHLPAGAPESFVRSLLGDLGEISKSQSVEIVQCLQSLRLVELRPDRRLRMLTPLRESARLDMQIFPSDFRRLIKTYLGIARQAGNVGRSTWAAAKSQVEPEAPNLDHICELASAQDVNSPDLEAALDGLSEYVRFTGFVLPRSILAIADGSLPKASGELIAFCNAAIARIEMQRASYDAALRRLHHASELFRRAGNEHGIANVTFSIGECHMLTSQLEEGRRTFSEALRIFRRVGDKLGEANCIKSLATADLRTGNPQNALTSARDAISLYESVGDKLGVANSLALAAQIDMHRAEFDNAIRKFEEIYDMFSDLGAAVGQATATCYLGMIRLAKGEYKESIPFFDRSIQTARILGFSVTEMNSQTQLAHALVGLGFWSEAKEKLLEARSIFSDLSNLNGVGNTEFALGRIAAFEGDFESSVRHFSSGAVQFASYGDEYWTGLCMVAQGRILDHLARPAATETIEKGFDLLFGAQDPEDRSLPAWHALKEAYVGNEADRPSAMRLAIERWGAVGHQRTIDVWSGL